MARSIQQLNYSSFSGGIITEASPLTFPDGASIEENNFELTKQGFRRRRLGLGAVSRKTPLSADISSPSEIVTFLWDNNGATGQEFLAVVAGNDMVLYDVTDHVPGEKLVYKTTIKGPGRVSLASHAGQLIIANGEQYLTIIRALGNDLFSERKERLKIRDIAGIPDYSRDTDLEDKVSLLNAAKAGYRPSSDELYLSVGFSTGTQTVTKPNPGGGGSHEVEEPRPPLPITPPQEVFYDFASKRLIVENDRAPDGALVTRHQLTGSVTFEEFMGYPIETFALTKTVKDGKTTYNFDLVFREGFYKKTIGTRLSSKNFQLAGGVRYTASLTASEYNSFLGLTGRLYLQEVNSEHHPHIYNLWNQGWGERRMVPSNSTSLRYPIDMFHEVSLLLPANSDNINSALYPNNQNDTNRTADRFQPSDLEANPIGSSVAPQGRYIIDALNRGETRNKAFLADLKEKGETTLNDTEMSFEYTTGGATTVAEYAGRVWYAGFSGDSSGSTLQLANKIMYGQTADDNLLSCYQEADPTSKDDSLLVDTDGGWVSIDAIDEVVKLVPTDTALLVFATNGVWAIAGSDGNTFLPTASVVIKITDKGSVNAQNIVQMDANLYFWAEDGLYELESQGFATFKLNPMTKSTINEMVLDLSGDDFKSMSGVYDERLDRLVWIIDGGQGVNSRRELIYHMAFSAFTVNTFYKGKDNGTTTEVLSVVKVPQFVSSALAANVVAGTDNVVAGNDNVVVGTTGREGRPSRVAYVAVTSGDAGSNLFFADLVRDDFKDWGLIDAPAHLLTGYVNGGDTSRQKQVPYLTVHCNRTETTATETGVKHESSCLIQSQWEWTNDPYANKWSPSFQAYRLPRPQIRGVGEPVAEGIHVVTTKNKLRGRGRTVSLKFTTEPDKDCQVLGWSMIAGANGNV